ncbi:hypothetical protein G4Y79_00070 [Phototrophicus methaneseepsis]|uniref:DUF2281 domain-containing protein n=1 Tax=Phototrophicus methaneseepsis TaxID=2710758 RepID=A0A7S8E9E5_9CHLR|nr:hypothetical protein [Phototrophicus methaneseepsis]QPC82806.1 hypothetical protein G4Y79_00070 [Phototrophicus methaneseepsis]
MERYSLREAQDQLGKLIDEAQDGKLIVILDDQQRAVQLVPLATAKKQRQPGSARGKIRLAPDFDAPLDDFDSYTK